MRTRLVPSRPPAAARRRLAITGIAAVTLAVASAAPMAAVAADALPAATSRPATHDPRFLAPVEGRPSSAPSKDRVVARVPHGDHVLTFVDLEAADTIGVYEHAKLGATPYLTAMAGDERRGGTPSALELFLAVSSAAPPPELVADHNRHRSGPPKAVELPTQLGSDPADGSCIFNDAVLFSSVWAINWHDGIGQQHDLHAELSFFDDINGSDGKVFDANRSSARFLAACNGGGPDGLVIAGFPDIYLEPQSAVNGTFTSHLIANVEPGTQEIFFSAAGPERWRLRMREGVTTDTVHQRNWAIGGAIDKPYGFVAKG